MAQKCGPNSMPTRCHIWVEFVACCFLYPGGGGSVVDSPVFLPLQIPTSPNSNLTRIEHMHEIQLRLIWLPS